MTGAYWLLVYQPLGLGGGDVASTIEGAGFDKLWAAQREPRVQYAAVAGVKAMGAVK
jgi:hypothetical protein